MELYNLGKVTWRESQLMYHAMAYLGREGLLLVSPAEPYVCIGFHQDVTQEVDLEYCRAQLSSDRGQILLDGLFHPVPKLFIRNLKHPGHGLVIEIQDKIAYKDHAVPDLTDPAAADLSIPYNHVVNGLVFGRDTETAVYIDHRLEEFTIEIFSQRRDGRIIAV